MGSDGNALVLHVNLALGRCTRPSHEEIAMLTNADLAADVKHIISLQWKEEATTGVPASADLLLNANHGKQLKSATVLYADLDGSTNMVDNYTWWFSAEVYRAYLRSAAQIIRDESGTITAYDGDRVMAIFVGGSKNTSAVRAALKINYAVEEILRPAIAAQYPTVDFMLKHVVAIDTSPLHAARIGVKGDNDLVWVGRAANYAAKLCGESACPIWVTRDVFDQLHKSVQYVNGTPMWRSFRWATMNNIEVLGTTYRLTLG